MAGEKIDNRDKTFFAFLVTTLRYLSDHFGFSAHRHEVAPTQSKEKNEKKTGESCSFVLIDGTQTKTQNNNSKEEEDQQQQEPAAAEENDRAVDGY